MSEWMQVKKLEMLVSKSELNLDINENTDILLFSCDLLNIARGRCNLKISKRVKKEIDSLYVHTDQPLMDVNIFYSSEKIERLINVLGMNKDNKKKHQKRAYRCS